MRGAAADTLDSAPMSDLTSTCAARGGSRLKARFLKTEEGAKLFQGFWDSKRNERCSFRLLWDGKVRCVPDADGVLQEGFAGFSDPACTMGTTGGASVVACTQPRYASSPPSPSPPPGPSSTVCGTGSVPYAVGPRLPAPTLYVRGPMGCQVRPPASMNVLIEFFFDPKASTPVPADEFVDGEMLPTPGRIVAPTFRGSDGSLQPGCATTSETLQDTELNLPCRLDPIANGRYICRPGGLWRASNDFADAACTRKVDQGREGLGCDVAKGSSVPTDSCSAVMKVTALGARATRIWSRTPQGACTEATIEPGKSYFERGPERTVDAPEMRFFLGVGTRVRARLYEAAAGGGSRLASGAFDDTKLARTCHFVEAVDGKQRCLPLPMPEVVDGFADPACTVPTKAAIPLPPPTPVPCSTEAAPAPIFGAQGPGLCGGGRRVFRLDGDNPQPLYIKNGATCGRDARRTLKVSDEVPPSEFASAEESLE